MTSVPDRPLVTAVVPAFDAAGYLREVLTSLRSQTYTRWEAVVVNDGSTDTTGEVADHWAERDARIRVRHQGNMGLAGARNAGLRMARGDFIHCLDADDLVDPAFYEAVVSAFRRRGEASPLDEGACAVSRVQHLWPGDAVGRVDGAPGPQEFRFEDLAERNIRPPVCHVFERRILERTGEFDESLDHCHDWDLWLRFARVGVDFLPVDDALAYYRLRPDSLSSKYPTYLRDGAKVMERAASPDPRCRDAVVSPLADSAPTERGKVRFWEQNLMRAICRADREGVKRIFEWGRGNLPGDFWASPRRYGLRPRFDWAYDAPPPDRRSPEMMWDCGEAFLSALGEHWPELGPELESAAARDLLSRLVDAVQEQNDRPGRPRAPRFRGIATLAGNLGWTDPRPLGLWLLMLLPSSARRELVAGLRRFTNGRG